MAAAQWQLAGLLAVVWTVTLLYAEWLQYWLHSPSCYPWPPEDHVQIAKKTNPAGVGGSENWQKVIVLSSPTLLASAGRAFLGYKVQNDLHLRRLFRSAILGSSPALVIVAGDLFYDGAQLSDAEWESSLRRYKHIFDPVVRLHGARRAQRQQKKTTTVVHQIPGNLDLLSSSSSSNGDSTKPKIDVLTRYYNGIGQPNFVVEVGAYQFVGINSLIVDDSPKDSNFSQSQWRYLDRISLGVEGVSHLSNVLLTHVPLSPLPDAPCTRSTESLLSSLQQQKPLWMSEESTRKLIKLLKPAYVVAGHASSSCWQRRQMWTRPSSASETTSSLGDAKAATATNASLEAAAVGAGGGGDADTSHLEMTVSSFNTLHSRNSAPFLLLRVPPENETDIAAKQPQSTPPIDVRLCLTPPQHGVFMWYIMLTACTVALFVLMPPRGPMPIDMVVSSWQGLKEVFRKAKLKVDAADDGYVEMFDTDGNLVLIPRVANQGTADVETAARTSDRRSDGPQARIKSSAPASDSAAVSVEDKEDATAQRKGASGLTMFGVHIPTPVTRLLSAAGPLAALIASQVALYMGLLAKDWA